MNDQVAKKRPLLCVVNGEHDEFIAAGSTELNYRVDALESNRISEIHERFDSMNPDCAVIFPESLGAQIKQNPAEWTEFKEYCEMRHIPLVAIIGNEERELKHAILADAFLAHPVDQTEFLLQVKKLIERRQRILDQIVIDPLTGANNYRYLQREVQIQLNDMKRSHETFSLVYVELDPIASENQLTKSALTQALVEFIQKSIRPTDCLAHHVEDGFVLVLPKTVKEDAMKLMSRLTMLFADVPIDTPNGAISATFSSKVREFVDAGLSADECLTLMPFASETDRADRRGLVLDGAQHEKNASVRKLKLAIIDDDRLIREMLKHQLSDIGENLYDVEIKTFADGEEFFEDPWHRQNERYLMIVDRIMPKMDGLEVLRRIRTGYDRRRYLIFMVSSKGAETDIALAIQRGANDYMVKPFSLKELRARIKRLIGGLR